MRGFFDRPGARGPGRSDGPPRNPDMGHIPDDDGESYRDAVAGGSRMRWWRLARTALVARFPEIPVAVLPRPGRSTDMLRVTLGDECHHVDRMGVVRTLREGSNVGALDDAILRCAQAFRTGPDGPDPEDEMAFGSFQAF